MDIFPCITVFFLKPLHSARDRNPYSSTSVAIARRLLVPVLASLRSIDRRTLDAPYSPYLSPKVTVNLTRGVTGYFVTLTEHVPHLCVLCQDFILRTLLLFFLFHCFAYMALKSTVVKGKTLTLTLTLTSDPKCRARHVKKKGIFKQTRPALQAITHRYFGSTQKLQQSLKRSQSRSLYINTPV